MSQFPNLDANWFKRFAVGRVDPEWAAKEWNKWCEEHLGTAEFTRKKYAIQLATDLAEATVRMRLEGNVKSLPAHEKWSWERLCAELHVPTSRKLQPDKDSLVRIQRVNLFTELDVPSTDYHWEVISQLVRQAESHRVALAIHPVVPSKLNEAAGQVVQCLDIDAVIMLRISPDAQTLSLFEDHLMPVVLIHADARPYESPVLTNVIPRHNSLRRDVASWAGSLPGSDHIVVVAMPYEQTRGSLRDERIHSVLDGLSGYDPKLVLVEDYSFHHALSVYENYREARGFVALSDSIAVGLKHLLESTGCYRDNVIGFDNSRLAHRARIPSVDQGLVKIGQHVFDLLSNCYRSEWSDLPGFFETEIDVRLAHR